jgi:energy-coupling factor transport system ATP-binding protein
MSLQFAGVSFGYTGETLLFDGLDLTFHTGEFAAVIGPNGSGKSTLARLFNGLLTPTSGTVTVNGLDTKDKKSLFDIRKTVGVVFQNPDNQLVASIVEDDVAFGVENIGLDRQEMIKRVDYALTTVGMQNFKNATPTRLSGGQKQRIAIAGVLAIMPKVLILDESTAMLDPVGRDEVMSVVKKLNKERGMTVIHITHYMDEIIDADKVIVLADGKVVLTGTPQSVLAKKEELLALGLNVPLSTEIATRLATNGIKLNKQILDKQDLGEALCELLQKA